MVGVDVVEEVEASSRWVVCGSGPDITHVLITSLLLLLLLKSDCHRRRCNNHDEGESKKGEEGKFVVIIVHHLRVKERVVVSVFDD